MVGISLRWAWGIVAAPILISLIGCGGGGDQHSPPIPNPQYAAEVAAELEGTPVPDGVDSTVWDKLVSEFLAAIDEADRERITSGVPADEFIHVWNFDYTLGPDDTVNLQWSYRNLGDYDLNGEVNVSDIVLIGRYWGAEASSDTWHIARRADGDGNGMITSGDLVPIARNYMGRVDSYILQSNAAVGSDSGWVDVETISWLDYLVEVDRFGRAQVSYPSTLVRTNLEYRLVPIDSKATDAITGIPSNVKTIYLTHGNSPDLQPKGQRRSRFTGPDTSGVKWIKQLPSIDLTRHPVVDGAGNFLYLANGQTLISLSPEDGEVNIENEYYTNILSFASDVDSIYFQTNSALNLLKPDGEVEWLNGGYGASSIALFIENNKLHHLVNYHTSSFQHSYANHEDYCNTHNIEFDYLSDTELFELWSVSTGHPGQHAIIAADGSVLTLTTDTLIKTSVDGTKLWKVDLAGSDIESAALLYSGEIVLLSPETIYIMSPDGEPVTNFQVTDTTPTTSENHLAISSNDEILVQVHNQLKCFDPTGALHWEISFSAEDSPVGRPYWHLHEHGNSLFIDKSDRVYVPVGSSHVDQNNTGNTGAYAVISAEGEVLNLIEILGRSQMTPLMFDDGLMYVLSSQPGSAGAILYCLDSSTPAPPPAPANLVASQGTANGRITLAWDGSNQASHYLVYRDGETDPVTTVCEPAWVDYGISDTNEHTYTVVAVNPNGMSETSAQTTGWIATEAPPVEPGAWNQWGGNAAHTGLGANVIPASLPEVEPIAVDDTPAFSILLTDDGSFFSNNNFDSKLTYFDETGQTIWEWPYALSNSFMHPALGDDGSIYVLCSVEENGPYCLNAWGSDHTRKWTYERPGDWFTNSPVVAEDGTIYLRSDSGRLHSVNPDGSVNWVIKHYGSYCYQNPTVAPDGTVYVVGEVGPELAGSSVKLPKASAIPGSNFLTAVHPDDGAMIWTYINTEREFDESPVVSPVGTILAMGENVLHALDDEGNFRWSFGPTGANYLLGVLPDGSAYIWNLQSESASTLYRINDSGDTMWRLDGYRIPMHLTVVDAVGNLLASNQDSDLVCLGPDGTERWTAQYDGEWISECFINGDGSLYLYTYDYMTYDHYLRIYPAD